MAPVWQFGLVGVLLVAMATDLWEHKIFNWLTFPAMLVGLLLAAWMGGWAGLGSAFVGLFAGSAVFLLGFLLGAMGGGDVKLMAAVGVWLGWPAALAAVIYVTFAGGLVAILVALAHGQLGAMLKNVYWALAGLVVPGGRPQVSVAESATPPFPYGVAIAIGSGLALVFPEPKALLQALGVGG